MSTMTDDLHEITRPKVYGLVDTDHELGGERLIYIGVTTRSLSRRRAQHFEEAKADRSSRPIHRYLRHLVLGEREDDITIQELKAFDTEAEAIEHHKNADCLLNTQAGDSEMPEYSGPEWTDEEIQMLHDYQAKTVAEKTGYKTGRVADARKRLGIDDTGILSIEDAQKAYVLYRATDMSYRELGDRFGVHGSNIGRIVRGDTYDVLDRDHLDSIVDQVQALLDGEHDDGPEAVLDRVHV